MKDLILITAFCNTTEKENYLRNLVSVIKKESNFDILITSHSVLPEDIINSVDYYFYDKENKLLKDFDLRNAAWFDPNGLGPINSIFTGYYNTHLAVWKLIIMGNSIAKNLGYKKVHHIEYDTEIQNFIELSENSELLNEYEFIYYDIIKEGSSNLLLGSFQSYLLDSLDPILIDYNEEKILDMIRNSYVKSPEVFLKNIIENKNYFLKKNINEFELNGMRFGHSRDIQDGVAWCLPYYDKKYNKLMFIVWNMEKKVEVNVEIIYNQDTIINISNVVPNEWRLIDLGDYNIAKKLTVILDNQIRNIYNFDQYFEDFKIYSYRES
jgi:hypothetical protein